RRSRKSAPWSSSFPLLHDRFGDDDHVPRREKGLSPAVFAHPGKHQKGEPPPSSPFFVHFLKHPVTGNFLPDKERPNVIVALFAVDQAAVGKAEPFDGSAVEGLRKGGGSDQSAVPAFFGGFLIRVQGIRIADRLREPADGSPLHPIADRPGATS